MGNFIHINTSFTIINPPLINYFCSLTVSQRTLHYSLYSVYVINFKQDRRCENFRFPRFFSDAFNGGQIELFMRKSKELVYTFTSTVVVVVVDVVQII